LKIIKISVGKVGQIITFKADFTLNPD